MLGEVPFRGWAIVAMAGMPFRGWNAISGLGRCHFVAGGAISKLGECHFGVGVPYRGWESAISGLGVPFWLMAGHKGLGLWLGHDLARFGTPLRA